MLVFSFSLFHSKCFFRQRRIKVIISGNFFYLRCSCVSYGIVLFQHVPVSLYRTLSQFTLLRMWEVVRIYSHFETSIWFSSKGFTNAALYEDVAFWWYYQQYGNKSVKPTKRLQKQESQLANSTKKDITFSYMAALEWLRDVFCPSGRHNVKAYYSTDQLVRIYIFLESIVTCLILIMTRWYRQKNIYFFCYCVVCIFITIWTKPTINIQKRVTINLRNELN